VFERLARALGPGRFPVAVGVVIERRAVGVEHGEVARDETGDRLAADRRGHPDGERVRRDDALAPLRTDVPERPPREVDAGRVKRRDDRRFVEHRQRHRTAESVATGLAGHPGADGGSSGIVVSVGRVVPVGLGRPAGEFGHRLRGTATLRAGAVGHRGDAPAVVAVDRPRERAVVVGPVARRVGTAARAPRARSRCNSPSGRCRRRPPAAPAPHRRDRAHPVRPGRGRRSP
jgi:hypothetical protein